MKFNIHYIKLFLLVFIISLSQISNAQKETIIRIDSTKYLEVNEIMGPDVQILKGNVILQHDSSIMSCDSAYFNTKENSFVAYGNIHIISPTKDQTDTVNLFGDTLYYSGKDRLAQVRNNVILHKDSMVLYTNFLDYDLANNIGYYFNKGRTLNGRDTLISKKGYYYANLDELYFKDSVVVKNPKYTIYSDTLKHQTKKKISYILGPTVIIGKDSIDKIYAENGWYNHITDIAQLTENPILTHGKQSLTGDSIYYDRKKGMGYAFNKVTITDTLKNIFLKGNIGIYNENNEHSTITDSALFIQIQKQDTLYLHADTIFSSIDTLKTKTDTTSFRLIKAFYRTKIFRADFQAKCDSLIYTFLDSTIKMYQEPIMWSGKNQLTADYIEIQSDSDKITQIIMQKNAMIASKSDKYNFNQIKGSNMHGYLENNQLVKIDVLDKGGAIYFTKDKNKLAGVNLIDCKNMTIYFENNEADRIWFYVKPKGTMFPPNYLSPEKLKYKNFKWFSEFRPKKWQDVYVWKYIDADKKEEKINKSDKNVKK